jgi:type IV fimbrial biogenesis protein FimT
MSMKRNGFTLIELMIVVGVLGILITLAAPSMYDFILTQRLKGISSQITTDMQFARSEATSRNQLMHVRFSEVAGASTCYSIYTGNLGSCNCRNTPVCDATGSEVRTVTAPASQKVRVLQTGNGTSADKFSYDPTTGSIRVVDGDGNLQPPTPYTIEALVDTERKLRTIVSAGGRPLTCAPSGSKMPVPACP